LSYYPFLAAIFAKGFEETPLPDNYFDVIVGNVPFGDVPVHDPAMKRQPTRAIHDYFFAKSLEKVRPGGVMALTTSRYTMDKLRLPNTAFKSNAARKSPPIFCSCANARPVHGPRAMPGAGLR
jgi:hypothetical protein